MTQYWLVSLVYDSGGYTGAVSVVRSPPDYDFVVWALVSGVVVGLLIRVFRFVRGGVGSFYRR